MFQFRFNFALIFQNGKNSAILFELFHSVSFSLLTALYFAYPLANNCVVPSQIAFSSSIIDLFKFKIVYMLKEFCYFIKIVIFILFLNWFNVIHFFFNLLERRKQEEVVRESLIVQGLTWKIVWKMVDRENVWEWVKATPISGSHRPRDSPPTLGGDRRRGIGLRGGEQLSRSTFVARRDFFFSVVCKVFGHLDSGWWAFCFESLFLFAFVASLGNLIIVSLTLFVARLI